MNVATHEPVTCGVAGEAPPRGKFLSGMQALIEGILIQRAGDASRRTAAFISGYRGSPLGGFDSLVAGNSRRLADAAVSFKPGLNEDLAATACWGTQQLALMDGPKYKGVTAFWYGKGPGVDRAGDIIKHANMAGTMPLGGVVMLVGDDHGAKSSTVAHQSDHALIAAGIPILYPATLQDYVDHIATAVALSRHAGVWVAFKCVTETVESSSSVRLDVETPRFAEPESARPAGGFHIGSGHQPVLQEHTLFRYRHPAAIAFATANGLDRTMLDAPERHLGIVAPGKSFVDLMEALRLLGNEHDALGVRVFKPLMVWPLAPEPVTAFMRGHREILVVEEKRGIVEDQLAGMTLRMAASDRPRLSGKLDADGAPLLADHGELDARSIARAVGKRLLALGLGGDGLAARLRSLLDEAHAPGSAAAPRLPAFCSGCPHNRSTKLPDGSMALGGIGCHGMALFVPELRTPSATHMGGEGANWIGLADYVATPHIFQNMGEGTYAHSGVLAIRAAVAAKVNITYKILFNGATAMTGGQAVEGEFTADDVARQLRAEGVARVVLVTEDIAAARNVPGDVSVLPRTELERVQRELRDVPGVTALIYEQGCAAERRRLRKIGAYPDPAVRTYINPEVCEGCGDCGRKSNCVSLVPLETELGRKRAVDQESCNKDYSCVEGFCPSFVTVKGGTLAVREISPALSEAVGAALAAHPVAHADGSANILFAGIGGTGVLTLGATIAKSALREGKRVTTFDVTGLAQKNGPVYSHVRIIASTDADDVYQPRIPAGQLDVLIGCDIVGSASPALLPLFADGRSRAFVNRALVPTATFQRDPDADLRSDDYVDALATALPPTRLEFLTAGPRARRMLGQGMLMNIAVMGFAFQRGAIPLAAASVEGAMMRRGEPDVPGIFAFRLGRLLAADPDRAEEMLGDALPAQRPALDQLPLEAALARCGEILTAYQNSAYASRHEAFVRSVAARDPAGELARAVAVNLFKLMRYKDEYEVARLYAEPAFMAGLRREFGGPVELNFNLAPPLIAWRRDINGEPLKIRFGAYLLRLFKIMAPFKVLRGTVFDPFGWSADRRLERALIDEYRGWIEAALARLATTAGDATYAVAMEIARLPQSVRGYGPVKDRSIAAARLEHDRLTGRLHSQSGRV